MNHHTALIGKIADEVYRSLGSGFSEDVYDRAMQVGLRLAGIRYENQKVVELKYCDHHIGEGYPDLLVHIDSQKIVIELKAVASELGACEEQQLRNYMKILGVECGLLINFQTPGRKQGMTQLEIREIAA
jgi:GxxExxY protein